MGRKAGPCCHAILGVLERHGNGHCKLCFRDALTRYRYGCEHDALGVVERFPSGDCKLCRTASAQVRCEHRHLGVLERYKNGECKLCARERSRERSRDPHEKTAAKIWIDSPAGKASNRRYRRKQYGTSKYRHKSWKAQGFVFAPGQTFEKIYSEQLQECAICRCDLTAVKRKDVHLDHDHARVGMVNVRGILCKNCNLMLGFAMDDADRMLAAVSYLRAWRGQFS